MFTQSVLPLYGLLFCDDLKLCYNNVYIRCMNSKTYHKKAPLHTLIKLDAVYG